MDYCKLTPSQNVIRLDEYSTSSKQPMVLNTLGVYVYVESGFDPACMEKAYWHLVEQNDALRLKIVKQGLKTMQYIKPFEPKPVARVTLENGETFFDEVKKYPKRVLQFFDDELCTADIIIDSAETGGIVVTMHHATSDGYSYSIMIAKLKEYYTAYKNGTEPAAEKVYSIADCLKASDKYMSSKQHKNDRKWWYKKIAEQKHYCIPISRRAASIACAKSAFSIRGETYEKLLALSRETGVSVNSIMLTAVAVTTAQITGKRNFGIFNMSHGRMTASQKKTVGCMMLSVPMFFDVPDERSVREYLIEAYKDYLGAVSHSRIPYAELIPAMYFKSLKCRSFMHEWLCFSQMDYRQEENDGFRSDAMPHYGLECQIYVGMLEGASDIAFEIEYQSGYFTPQRIAELWDIYESVVSAMVGAPDSAVAGIVKGKGK